jgi:hypothetical protein
MVVATKAVDRIVAAGAVNGVVAIIAGVGRHVRLLLLHCRKQAVCNEKSVESQLQSSAVSAGAFPKFLL